MFQTCKVALDNFCVILYRTNKKRKLCFDEESFEMEIENYILILLLFVPLSPSFSNDSKTYMLELSEHALNRNLAFSGVLVNHSPGKSSPIPKI